MGRADVVAASMLPATSEAFGAVRRLRPAVSAMRRAPVSRRPATFPPLRDQRTIDRRRDRGCEFRPPG